MLFDFNQFTSFNYLFLIKVYPLLSPLPLGEELISEHFPTLFPVGEEIFPPPFAGVCNFRGSAPSPFSYLVLCFTFFSSFSAGGGAPSAPA
ncbi:MAG: hypothetical protein C6I01_06640 [Epsilonproteobacteria bacterium]|nr:hypothetical protein [Campylobacterota bacterium]